MSETEEEAPDGLGVRGAKFWLSLTADMEFDAKESEVLLEVCRTLDRIDALAAAVDADGTMITGSMGQRVLHPAVGELRQQQAAFVRLVADLHLPEDVAAQDRFNTARGKAGAAARWDRPLRAVR
ncbi:terminase [Microbacterium sulfonylureivorans]|uniref:terminase n=1 Tax=Microbacterium sulfonylureivorans TaxID=2486854 RepID=UPI000FD9BC85|nr:terminase [Microbacterium sulfonylureivorans]